MRVFFDAIIVQCFLNIYVLWRGCQVMPSSFWKKLLIGLFGIEVALYFIGFFYGREIGIEALHCIGLISTSWMILIIYTTVLFFLYDILRYLFKRSDKLNQLFNAKKTRAIYYIIVLLFVVSVMIYGNYKFKHPEISVYNIEINKPFPVDSMRIVVATDWHAGVLINKEILAKYVDLILDQKPDLILMPGDIIDFDLYSVEKQHMQDEFNRLKATYGVFASTGNHDYIELSNEKPYAKVDWLSNLPALTLLRDSTAFINESMYLIGREDDLYEHRLDSIPQILNRDSINTQLPVILINHEPRDIEEADRYGIDLAFYGHTHNGQFFPANIISKFVWSLPFGYRKINDSHVYVSSGLGLAGPQYRIATISEIVVFNVHFNNSK